MSYAFPRSARVVPPVFHFAQISASREATAGSRGRATRLPAKAHGADGHSPSITPGSDLLPLAFSSGAHCGPDPSLIGIAEQPQDHRGLSHLSGCRAHGRDELRVRLDGRQEDVGGQLDGDHAASLTASDGSISGAGSGSVSSPGFSCFISLLGGSSIAAFDERLPAMTALLGGGEAGDGTE